MKYALFEFEEENNSQLSVGEISLIIYVEAEMCNNDDFDLSEPIQVAWNDGKVYFAKVHRFSGKTFCSAPYSSIATCILFQNEQYCYPITFDRAA
jgi:hypothetical protein